MKGWSVEESLLELKGLSNRIKQRFVGRGCGVYGAKLPHKRGRPRGIKKKIQELKKPAIPRNNKISFSLEETARDWISIFLSKVIVL